MQYYSVRILNDTSRQRFAGIIHGASLTYALARRGVPSEPSLMGLGLGSAMALVQMGRYG